ncbi:MAG: hypothetical protein E2O79_08950 [Caldithrix sp.]|nr:MAG: hypothetical protein E2O79_08950 [Caldithrix sp.]
MNVRVKQMSVIEYKIGKKLYEDLIGTVYTFSSAESKKTGQIKILHEEFAKHDDLVQAFHKCAEKSCTIRNPNYITPQLHAHENGLHFMVLEECDLIPLSILLKKTEVLSISDSIEAIEALAKILRHAHLDEVIHSHLAPESILSDSNLKQFRISNFGFAEFIGLLIKKQHGSLSGTLPYYSPELIQGNETLKRQSDIYPLGVLFYRLLVGEIPWKGQESGDYFLNPHPRTVVPPSLQRLEIPELLDELVLEALEPTVDNRCPNMSQFIEKIIDAKSEIIASLTPADRSFHTDALHGVFEETDETAAKHNENQKKDFEQNKSLVDTTFSEKSPEELAAQNPKPKTETKNDNGFINNDISQSDSVDAPDSESVETQDPVTDQQNKTQNIETDIEKTNKAPVVQKEDIARPDASSETTSIPTITAEQEPVLESSQPEIKNPQIRPSQAASEAAPTTKEENPAGTQAEGDKVAQPDKPILGPLDNLTPQTETLKTPAAPNIEAHEDLAEDREKETESPLQREEISNEMNTDSSSFVEKAPPQFERPQEPPIALEAVNALSTSPQEPPKPPADELEQNVVSANNELSNNEPESENPDIHFIQSKSAAAPFSKEENPAVSQKTIEKITAPDEQNLSLFLRKKQEPDTPEVPATPKSELQEETGEQAMKTAQPPVSQTEPAINQPQADSSNLEKEAPQQLNKFQKPEPAPEQRLPEDNISESHESPKPTETLNDDLQQEPDFENSQLSKIETDRENRETTLRQEKSDSDAEINNEQNENAQEVDQKDTESKEPIASGLPGSTIQRLEEIEELTSSLHAESEESTFDEKEKAPEPLPNYKENPHHNQDSDSSSLEKGPSLNLEESSVLLPPASAEDKSVQLEKLPESDILQPEEIISPPAGKVETEPPKQSQSNQETDSLEKESQQESAPVNDSKDAQIVLPQSVINSSSNLLETAEQNDAEEFPVVEERPEQQPASPQSRVEKNTPPDISEQENIWPEEKNEIREILFNQAAEELDGQLAVQSLDSSPPAADLPNNQNEEQSQISQDSFAQKPVVPFDLKDESSFAKEKPKSSITPNFYKKQLHGGSIKNVLKIVLIALIPITVIYLLIAITFDFNFTNKSSSLKERFITKKTESVNPTNVAATSSSLGAKSNGRRSRATQTSDTKNTEFQNGNSAQLNQGKSVPPGKSGVSVQKNLPPVSELKLQLSVRGGGFPQASDIFVNGINYGKTSNQGRILLSNLALNQSYVIKVEKQGFEMWAKEVVFSTLGTKELNVALKSLPSNAQSNGGQKIGKATLTILLSNPQNVSSAYIYIDGKLWRGGDNIAPAKLQLPAGNHKVEVKRDGFRSHPTSQFLTLANGENRTINFYLIPN